MREDLLPITWDGKLSRLEEEIGEVIKAIGKLRRFGEYATDPKTGIPYQNKQDLFLEIIDLQSAINELVSHKDPTENS
jgi:hypothetical protein